MRYLILGNGAAGATAAVKLREMDASGEIKVVSYEDTIAYSKIMLPDYIGGKISKEKLMIRPEEFYIKNNIHLLLGKQVTGIDVAKKEVLFTEGKEGFDRLLIGVGGIPFVPPITGLDTVKHYKINSLKDADTILGQVQKGQTAIIAGGGLTGVEMAFALSRLGMKVKLIEREQKLLPSLLEEESSKVMESWLKKEDIDIMTGVTLEEVYPKNALKASADTGSQDNVAQLSNGGLIGFDMLVLAIGTRSNTSIVENTPIRCHRGILVNEHMQTSEEGIYAAGDVAEIQGDLPVGYVPGYIWPNAMAQGKCAAMNMAGVEEVFSYQSAALNKVQLRDMPFVCMGWVKASPEESEILIQQDALNLCYKKIVIQGNQVKGMILIGDVSSATELSTLLRNKTDVSDLKGQWR